MRCDEHGNRCCCHNGKHKRKKTAGIERWCWWTAWHTEFVLICNEWRSLFPHSTAPMTYPPPLATLLPLVLPFPNYKPFGINTPHTRSSIIPHPPAYGDGTDREFQNVGFQRYMDAGDLSKR